MRLVALFNLKPGVTPDEYEAWARTTDIPTVRGLGSIAGFEVMRVTGVMGSEAAPPYRYIEIIDVPDMAAFGRDVATETMQQVALEFQAIADVTFLTTEPLPEA